jgi:hypothetical protein
VLLPICPLVSHRRGLSARTAEADSQSQEKPAAAVVAGVGRRGTAFGWVRFGTSPLACRQGQDKSVTIPSTMTTSRRRSYAWALQLNATEIPESRLTPAAVAGLIYATWLAENAHERSQDPRPNLRPEPLTVEQLAREYEVPTTTIQRQIKLARRQLFGSLSDAAIAKRAQRQKGRPKRTCQHPGCTQQIVTPEHGNRRYCPTHRSGKARVSRHRANRREPPQSIKA